MISSGSKIVVIDKRQPSIRIADQSDEQRSTRLLLTTSSGGLSVSVLELGHFDFAMSRLDSAITGPNKRLVF